MENMQDVIDRLKAKRTEHTNAVDRINKAIELLGSNGVTRPNHGTTTNSSAPKTMSLAARRKISIAMKARHSARRNGAARIAAPKKLHWTQTPEGRKKFAKIRAKANHRKAA